MELRDETGVELESMHSAKCHAVKMIAYVLCKEPERFWRSDIYRVSIADDRGLLLLSVEMVAQAAPALWQTSLRIND